MPRARAIEALDEAMGADLVRAGDALGAYRFAHAQIREAVYEVLPHGRRVRLHHGIARELEALADETGDLDVAQVAHHCFAAIEIGDPEKAVDYCRRAGARAEASLAYEDAVAFRSRALHAFTLGGAGGQARRCSLLIELGEARLKADDVEAARGDLQSAVEIARELGLVDELAAAALGLAAMNQYGEVDELAISALEDALRLLPPVDSRVRACVMGLLSTRLDRRTDADRRAELSGEAVAMARRLADGEALGTALTQRIFAIRDPACLSELIEAADESAQLAMRSGTPAAALWAHVCRLICRLELGDLPAADAALTAYLKAADTSRQPYYRWYGVMLRATRRLLEGDFEEGERLAREALRLREAHDPGANEIFVAQSFMLAAERGSLAELDPAEPARLAAEYDSVPAWRAMLARVHAAAGRRAAAQAILHHDASDGFADVRRSDDWLTALALLAEVAAALGDGDRTATLLELLAPWAARSIVFDYGWGDPEDGALGAARALRRRGVRRIVFVGSSFGTRGAVIAGAARRDSAGVVCLSFAMFQPVVQRAARRLRAGVLLVTAENDQFGALEDSQHLYALIPATDKRLLVMLGSAHGIDLLRDAQLRDTVVAWLRDHLHV
jgi:hypothetical protein